MAKLTSAQKMYLKKKLADMKRVVAKPKHLTAALRIDRYNVALATANFQQRLTAIPQPSVTLTPASPRSSNTKSYLRFWVMGTTAMGEWDSSYYDPNTPEGFIHVANSDEWMFNGAIRFDFETSPGKTYVVEIQTSVINPSPAAAWEIYDCQNESMSTFSANTSPIIFGFVAGTSWPSSAFILTYCPKASSGSVVSDRAYFFGCKLTPIS